MKTLLLAGGMLLLLLGFLLLVAAVVVFLVGRNKRATVAVPAPPPPLPVAPVAPVVPPPFAPVLHGISGLVAGQTFPIPTDGVYIGRDRVLSQIVVDDASVSKKHVWIGLREGIVMAIDQSSTNGTYVNTIGTRIGQVQLSPGDTLILSDDVARFVYKA